MKKIVAVVLIILFSITFLPPSVPLAMTAIPATGMQPLDNEFQSAGYTYADLKKLPSKPSFDSDFLPASPKWLNYVSNETPATFKKEYELADNVIVVNKTVTDSIADMGQILSGSTVQKLEPNRIIEKGGYISRAVLDNAASQKGRKVESGSVVVDDITGTAFKVVSPTIYSGVFDADPELSEIVKPLENTYSLTKPELHEVIKYFDLPEQTVTLNKANITGFAPNVESSFKLLSAPTPLAVGDEDKMFKTLTGDNLINLNFKDTPLQGKVGNSTINIKLSGGMAIDGVDLTGRYSGMGGYEISMTLQQECYVVAELDAEIHEEIKIPILGIDIPFGVGEVYGGIFAMIGMNGEVRLGIEARETNSCKMGIEGGTFLYVPTSFHPIFEPTTPKITGDCSMNGKINGYVKFGPMLGIEIFGFDLVGAGVLLGAGVNVQSDGSMLDIELYASIDVYIKLLDECFSLVSARPTIYKKQQPDMHGYKVSFLETYVNPGRVGGLIEKEPQQAGGEYIPSVNLEYKVWIVPKSAVDSFEAAKRKTILSADRTNTQKALKDKVRTYPDNAFAKTNDEGEFIEKNNEICYGGDQVYLEFEGDGTNSGTTFFVGPATPVLPFTDITITYADYFNDFITGKVEPKRLIRWNSNRFDPTQEQQELTYYKGPIFISPFNDYGMNREIIPTSSQRRNTHRDYIISGTACTDTNELGEFDTRKSYAESGPSGKIDVLSEDILNDYMPSDAPPSTIGVLANLKVNEEVKDITIYGITPAAPEFQFTRTLDFVEGPYKRLNEGDKIVDQMVYDEYLWIANPVGTRTITADMFEYYAKGFSTQDYKGYYENPVKETREGPITLTPVLDKDGNPTGSALFAQRVTVEWVWQEHPNPIKITSPDHTLATAGEESSFQVKADGFLPRFSLEGEPQRVWIDENTGLLYIPNTLNPGVYTFTIHAKEGNIITQLGGPDPKRGNDPSPPDKQIFTLTVAEKASEPSPSQTPESSSTPTTNPDARTAPVIRVDEYNTFFTMDGSNDLMIPFQATGSEPITWSLTAVKNHTVPEGITMNAATGMVTVKKSLGVGEYYFAVKASNDVGFDTHECTLVVSAKPLPHIAPKISGDMYFTMTRGTRDLKAGFTATGSQPIAFSVKADSATGAPAAGISINAGTGVLTVNKEIAAGHYSIAVTASNDVGKDTIECSLEVKAPEVLKAPVLDNRRDGYKFKMSSANTEFSVQLSATGSAPITYSLEPLSERMSVPSEITIDADTGLLAIKGGLIGGIKAGNYSFIVKASNDVGSDTRECLLEVTALTLPPIKPFTPKLSAPADGSLNFIPLANSTKPRAGQNVPSTALQPDLFAKEPPPNKLTIRCDDPKDVYTHDRDIYNGAYFICWDISAVVSIIDVMVDPSLSKVYSDYTFYNVVSWGDEVKINDNSPVCDQYHYYDRNSPTPTLPLTEEQLAKMRTNIKKVVDAEIAEYKNGYKTVNQDLSVGGLRDRYSDFTTNPLEKAISSLEYGSLIKEINGQKGGAYNVELNLETGTVIPGEYFTSLLNNPKASVSFKQNGADITFAGKDITTANDIDLFNIGFTSAPHKKAMLESIGTGFESFAYGFQHHGELPGMATFAITTTLAEGTKVNVYKFDAAANQFTLIAGNMAVGAEGVVTYKNNTMSEYVVTTKTLAGAAVSDVAARQGFMKGNNWWLAGIGLLAILSGTAFYIYLRKRRRISRPKTNFLSK